MKNKRNKKGEEMKNIEVKPLQYFFNHD